MVQFLMQNGKRLGILLAALMLMATMQPTQAKQTPNPILFVTQIPNPIDFTTIGSTFGNHLGTPRSVPRGGDLWIRYGDGTMKNLTEAAGVGEIGLQLASSIAVRDPQVHWSGTKAIFSMIVGAPERYRQDPFYWQLYEITGLGKDDTPVITAVPNQPSEFNNITPAYASDDTIIFTTDRPHNGARHLYPQLDEYEEAPTVSGLWKLDPSDGALTLLDHAPSGAFEPFVDSFGRIVYTRWDHLQRDQQADSDRALEAAGQPCSHCTFNWTSESADSTATTSRDEVFPEPRMAPDGSNFNDHRFNHFFPWMINQDGTEHETLNHIGRQELHGYIPRARNDDASLNELIASVSGRVNSNEIHDFFQISEDPSTAGRYIGVDAPEFATHAAGQIVAMQSAPADNPDNILVEYITHRDTANTSHSPSADHSGLYRDPIILTNGTIVVVHTAETRADANDGSGIAPQSRYDFHLKTLVQSGDVWVADQLLTPVISKTVSYYSPDVLVSYSGPLWQLQPVEVRARTAPAATSEPALSAPEQSVVDASGVDWAAFQTYLEDNNLAVVVSRNVTQRDDLDKQQPFNLRVPNGAETVGGAGTRYDIAYMQFFQGDQIRGLERVPQGRRVLAQPMHDATNIANNGPTGSVALGLDGSMAAFVPAQRALTWQLTDAAGEGVVRERYWLTFQPGEVRVCGSCHGVNLDDQAGGVEPTNPPQAFADLLTAWQCDRTPSAEICGGTSAVQLNQLQTRTTDANRPILFFILLGSFSLASLSTIRQTGKSS